MGRHVVCSIHTRRYLRIVPAKEKVEGATGGFNEGTTTAPALAVCKIHMKSNVPLGVHLVCVGEQIRRSNRFPAARREESRENRPIKRKLLERNKK